MITLENNNLIVANIDGSNGESITGSALRDVIFVGDGDTVEGMGGGDLLVFADGDIDMTLAQSIAADSSNLLTRLVEASSLFDVHTQQTAILTTVESATVVGFETGWSIEGGSTDKIMVDESAFFDLDVKFDFDDEGLTISDGAGSLFLAANDADVLPTVSADILINDQRVTAARSLPTAPIATSSTAAQL